MITLYYAPDNASLIVRIVLEEIGLPYKSILVDRSKREQNSAHYLKLNPNGMIPVCIIHDQPVYETAAIVLTLADAHDQLHVHADDVQRPQFLKWLFFLSNSLHNDLRQRFYPEKYVGSESSALEMFSNITLKRLSSRLKIVEAQYATTSSDYLFGCEPSIVDIYLALCMRWSQLYPMDNKGQIKAGDYPAIEKMLSKLQARPAVICACEKDGIRGTFFTDPNYAQQLGGVAS